MDYSNSEHRWEVKKDNHTRNYTPPPSSSNINCNNYHHVVVTDVDNEYFRNLPPGYRFLPTDKELILEYLLKKVSGQQLPRNRIQKIDVYKHKPDTLTEKYPLLRERDWYFFTQRHKKYPNGSRPDRSVEDGGFWKPTGTPKPLCITTTNINNQPQTTCIGLKRSLDFHNDRNADSKTDWKMHEYTLCMPHPTSTSTSMKFLDGLALCKIYKAADRNKKRKYKDEDEEDVGLSNGEEKDEEK